MCFGQSTWDPLQVKFLLLRCYVKKHVAISFSPCRVSESIYNFFFSFQIFVISNRFFDWIDRSEMIWTIIRESKSQTYSESIFKVGKQSELCCSIYLASWHYRPWTPHSHHHMTVIGRFLTNSRETHRIMPTLDSGVSRQGKIQYFLEERTHS